MKIYLFLVVCFLELLDGLISYFAIKSGKFVEAKKESLFFMKKFGLLAGIVILFFIQVALSSICLLFPEVVADIVLMIMAGLLAYANIKNLVLIQRTK